MFKYVKFLRRTAAQFALALAFALIFSSAAAAQSTTTYSVTNDGTINSTNCASGFSRSFSVTANVLITDIEIGVLAEDSTRGNLRMVLESPAGTSVQIVNGNTSVSGDNFNVLLSDGAAQLVNTIGNTTNHSTTAPPFQNTFRPNNLLSAFDGELSQGTWQLRICEVSNSGLYGNGTFRHAELYVTGLSSFADLSLSKSVSSGSPVSGAAITYSLTVANAGSSASTATGVTVTDLLPAGVGYVSHSGTGSYDAGTGLWSVGSIAPGQNRSLTITVTVTASSGATVLNTAEISASSVLDPDSTPNNDAAGEDDYGSASFTVSGPRVAGIPPNLVCPKSTILFDWDTRAWTAGATSGSFAVTGLGTMSFSIINPATWMNVLGGINPRRTNTVTGGLPGSQYSLAEGIDFANASQKAVTTIALPLAVDGLQFRIFDVDYYSGQFADYVRVVGTFNGTTVVPVLTNGVSNYVVGNQAFGDALSADASSDGNITVTFQSAVDTVTIEYGNHALAPANPGGQAITIHDITLCEPHAAISVTKIGSVLSDPVRGATNPLAIPGAVMSYCILVSNAGSATATAVAASDVLPPTMTFVAGSMRSGASCGSASTVEDDNAAGADEADPVGASAVAGLLSITTPSLGISESIALTFSTTIN